MTEQLRSVRRLRLAAADSTAAGRGVRLIEDALRCASLPDSGRRLVLVRRLALGMLPARLSSQALALRIEHAWAAGSARRVHGGDALAGAAAVVCFADALDAHRALGLRLVAGSAPDEWFWPLAIAGYQPGLGIAAALRQTLGSLAREVAAGTAVPAWITAMADAGGLAVVAAALGPGDVAELRLRIGLPARVGRDAAAAADVLAGSSAAPCRTGGADVGEPAAAGAAQPASGNRAGCVRIAELPPQQALVWQFLRDALDAARPRRATASERAEPLRRQPLAPAAAVPEITGHRAAKLIDADAPTADALAVGAASPGAPAKTAQAAPAAQRAGMQPTGAGLWPDALPTAAGGLLFLVPVLQGVAMADAADRADKAASVDNADPAEADAGTDATLPLQRRLVAAVFGQLLERLGIAGDDPAWLLAPGARDGAPPLDDPALARHAAGWLSRCRRRLRRQARIGLASLVRRPALLALTPTHADVIFDLGDADLRVRRAGLDINPGWVEWLGRVVTFHYEAVEWQRTSRGDRHLPHGGEARAAR